MKVVMCVHRDGVASSSLEARPILVVGNLKTVCFFYRCSILV